MSPQLLDAEWSRLETAALTESRRKFNDLNGSKAHWSTSQQAKYERLTAKVRRLFLAEVA
jgi:hypothetical protein